MWSKAVGSKVCAGKAAIIDSSIASSSSLHILANIVVEAACLNTLHFAQTYMCC